MSFFNLLASFVGADASRKAANTQADSAREAAALQKEQFNKVIELQAPFREAGLSAQNRLLQYLGFQSGAAPKMRSEAELRNALASKYMKSGTGPESGGYYEDVWEGGGDNGPNLVKRWVPRVADTVDEAGLSEAIKAAQAEDQAAQQAYEAQKQSPDFGKYTKDFSMKDFEQDPGYAFRMSEGLKALDRQAAARGGLISGAALKATTRYGQDQASNEYTNAFNRYQTNRANQLNPLQSLMGAGQTAANTVGTAGQNYANQAGEAYMGAGNTRASGYIGSANALAGGLNQYLNRKSFGDLMRGDGYTSGGSYGSNQPDNIDVGGGFKLG